MKSFDIDENKPGIDARKATEFWQKTKREKGEIVPQKQKWANQQENNAWLYRKSGY